MEMTNILLWCGIIGGPLFVIVFLVEGALREGYNPMRSPVSALAMGKRGWVQRANFIVTGILMFCCALGMSSALDLYGGSFWGPFLIGIYAFGLVGAGVFVTDLAGDPNNRATKRPIAGILHDLSSLFVFIPLFIAMIVFHQLFSGVGQYGWAIYSGISAATFVIGFMLFARGFGGAKALGPTAGLVQRLTITVGWIWIALIAAHLLG